MLRKENIELLLQTTIDGIHFVKINGNIVEANNKFCEMLGYSRSELLKLNFTQWNASLTLDKFKLQLKKTTEFGQTIETRHRCKDGSIIDIELMIKPIKIDGKLLYLCTSRDISERNRAEASLRKSAIYARRLIETSIDPLVTISPEGKITDVNTATEKITGVHRDQLIGSDFSNYFTDIEQARKGYQKAFSEGYVKDFPLVIKHTSAKLTQVLYNASVYKDEQNNVLGVFAAARDITEQVKAEKALKESKKMAERVARLKSEFLANMSHEIRTPMNGIIGLSNLALNEETSPEVRVYLTKILSSSQSLLNILNDILDFSKIEAGRMNIENNPFSLGILLNNLKNLFEEKASSKKIKFDIEIEQDTPMHLIGDPLRIQQILSNLIGNAIKFTDNGQIKVKLSAEKINAAKTLLNFEVHDTGIGIAPESIDKLFCPFSQVDSSISRKFGGTGLGLAISQNLLQLLGSRFNVSSKLGQGSVFSFKLHLDVVTQYTRQTVKPRANFKSGELANFLKAKTKNIKNAKILIAEDDPINQLVIKKYLEISGLNPTIVNDGEAAIEILKHQKFDIILMDIHMPIMDGLEATRKIRSKLKHKNIPILALSAGVTKEEQEVCLLSGMNDFIAKPFNHEVMINSLLKWIDCENNPVRTI